jgi:uncharacterized protein YndB with AHSA1/START domain
MTTPTPTGRVTVDGDHTTMSFRRRLPYPIDVVWQAITDPAQRAQWFGTTIIEPREGGLIEVVPGPPPAPEQTKRVTGRIQVWDPPRVFEHEWHSQLVEDSVVRYELTPDGEHATVLDFTHRGLTVANTRGWIPGTHAFIDRLAAHLASEPLPDWQARYDEVAPAYA